jgi:predicted nucleic acid-binding protein
VPGHWLVEVLSVIRGNLLGGKISAAQAAEGARAAMELDPLIAPARVLAPRIWALRANLTTCDAAYVATAERYECALLSTDARLTRAPGVRCSVLLLP